MQSQNGDVELSVRLDTSGLKSDAQRIKAEIEKSVGDKSGSQPKVTPVVDDKKVAEQLNEISKKDAPKITVTAEVDEAALQDFEERWQKAEGAEKISLAKEAMSELSDEAQQLLPPEFTQFIEDYKKALEIPINNSNVSEELETEKTQLEQSAQAAEQVAEELTQVEEIQSEQAAQAIDNAEAVETAQTQQAEHAVQEAQEVKEAYEEVSEFDYTPRFDVEVDKTFEEQLQTLTQEAEKAKEELDMLSSGHVYSNEYKAVSEDVSYLEKQLQKANDSLRQMELSGQEGTSKYDEMANKAYEYEKALEAAKSVQQDMAESGGKWTEGFDTAAIAQAEKNYNAIADKIALIKTNITGLTPNERINQWITNMRMGLAQVGGSITGAVSTGLKRLGSMSAKAFSNIRIGIGKAIKSLGTFAKHNSKAFSLKHILQYTLGIRSIFALFNKLRSVIKEGFSNLAQLNGGNNELNKSLSTLQSSLAQMKNALSAAFAPIVTAITPMLNSLIQMVTRAATAIGQFIAALTGKNTFTKATEVQKNYAQSLDNTGNAAKKAAGKLASFDDLDVLGKEDEDGGGGGGGGVNPADMFEETEIDPWFKDFIDKLKEMWEKADFTELGAMIGKKLKEMLENIPWDAIQAVAVKLGKSLATLLNGFFEVEGLGLTIGKTLAEAFNTALLFLNAFIMNFHWDSFGKFIGDVLNGVVYNIKWDVIAQTLAEGFNGVLKTIDNIITTFDFEFLASSLTSTLQSTFQQIDFSQITAILSHGIAAIGNFVAGAIKGIDWSQVPKDITNALLELWNGIDWNAVTTSLENLLNAVFTAAFDFIVGCLELGGEIRETLNAAFEDMFDYFAEWIEIAGGDIPKGLLLGILNGLAQIGMWIREHIFKPIVDAFCNAFGIHSPSTVFESFGEDIMQGLINGIQALVQLLIEAWNWIKDKVVAIVESLCQKAIEIWNWLKDTVLSIIQNLGNMLSALWEGIKSVAVSIWEAIKSTVSGLVSGIWNFVTTTIQSLKDALATIWEAVKSKVVGVWEAIKTSIKNAVEGIKSNSIAVVTAIKTKIESLWLGLKTKTSEIFDGIKKKIVDVWSKIKEGIKAPINGIIGIVEGMLNKLIDGLNWFIDKLNSISIDITNPFDTSQKYHIGVDIPKLEPIQIPRLAQGAVIPPNREFLAMLGDQKYGTNIEAPLDTIKQAFEDVVGNLTVENTGNAVMQVDGRTFAKLMTPYVVSELDRRGYNVSILEA